MVGLRTNQPSFAAGILGEDLQARIDLAKYAVGLKVGRNFVVHSYGGVSNRAGFEFIGESLNNTPFGTIDIEFQAAIGDSYILEFGDRECRVFRSGAPVIRPPGTPNAGLQVVFNSPYSSADLAGLDWTQSNDVMTMTHPGYPVWDLTRFDHHDWRFDVIDFRPPVDAPPTAPTVAVTNPDNSSDDDYQPQRYNYRYSAIVNGQESMLSPVGFGVNDLSNSGKNVNRITVPEVAGATEYKLYKDQTESGFYGFLATVLPEQRSFLDRNVTPDNANGPQTSSIILNVGGRYPSRVTYFQQRRIFAASTSMPQTFYGTKVNALRSVMKATPAKEDDAFEYTLASNQRQTIKHLVTLDTLILMTQSAEWVIKGRTSSVVSGASPPLAEPQSYYGSSDVKPLVVGDEVLFVQATGSSVRNLGYSFEKNRYAGEDLTILCRSLFEGREIRDWAYAKSPHSVVWCAMTDGSLLSFTYLREQQVWAWMEHPTDGFVESVAAITEEGEDFLYLIVRRTRSGAVRRYKERMHSRYFTDVRDGFFVDSGLTYDEPRLVSQIIAGNVFTVASHGFNNGDLIDLTHEGYRIDERGDKVKAIVQRRYTATNVDGSTGMTLHDDEIGFAKYELQDAVSTVRKAVRTIGGLDHLEGRAVVALADGNVIGLSDDLHRVGELVVSGGSITLPEPASRVHVGLQYVSEIETLEMMSAQDELSGRLKNVEKFQVKVRNTRGIVIGASRDALLEAPLPVEYDSTDMVTGQIEVVASGQWGLLGNGIIRQDFPLPATILSITPSTEIGG